MSRQRTTDWHPVVQRVLQAMEIAGKVPPGQEIETLAKRLGTTLGNARNWTKRKGGVPPKWVAAVAAISNTPHEWFYEGIEEPYGPKVAAAQLAADASVGQSYAVDAMAQRGFGLSASVAQESTPPWKLPPTPDSYDAPRSRGVQMSQAAGILVTKGAGAHVLPLLLSLPLGERGGDQAREYELIPKRIRRAGVDPDGDQLADAGSDRFDLAGDMAYSFAWLRKNLGHTSGQLSSMEVRGDNMTPTLRDGDTIMLDEGVETVDVPGIYVLDVGGRRMVTRAQRLFDGSLVLISDNSNYQRETIPRNMVPDLRVIGRMVWPRL